MPIENYEVVYSKMSDDEILHLACEGSGLREEARYALNGELKKRKLTEHEVSEYRQHLASIKPGVLAENQKYLTRSFMGYGTALYGKRDFHPDGSYITTMWVTMLWVPVFPLKSLRISKTPPATQTVEPKLTKHYYGYH